MKIMVFSRFIFFAMSALLSAEMVYAQVGVPPASVPDAAAGIVTNLQGSLSVTKAGSSTQFLGVDDSVKQGDVLSTSAGTFARLRMVDGAELILRPNSRAEITQYVFKPSVPSSDSALITLIKGGIRSLTGLLGKRNPQQVTFRTATATVGIRGTEVGIRDCNNDCNDLSQSGSERVDNGTHVEVTSGAVEVSIGGRRLLVRRGQNAVVRKTDSTPRIVQRHRAAKQNVPGSIRTNFVPLGSNSGRANVQDAPAELPPLPNSLPTGQGDKAVGSQTDISAALSNLPPTASGGQQSPEKTSAVTSTNQPVFQPSFSPTRGSTFGGGGLSSVSPN